MNLQLTILTIFPDLFLGISIMCLLFHCLFFKSKQTNNFFIFDKSMLSLFSLIVLILLVLLLNCNCFDLNSDSVVSDISCNNLKMVITFVSIFFFLL